MKRKATAILALYLVLQACATPSQTMIGTTHTASGPPHELDDCCLDDCCAHHSPIEKQTMAQRVVGYIMIGAILAMVIYAGISSGKGKKYVTTEGGGESEPFPYCFDPAYRDTAMCPD